jgi:hypothetical protein
VPCGLHPERSFSEDRQLCRGGLHGLHEPHCVHDHDRRDRGQILELCVKKILAVDKAVCCHADLVSLMSPPARLLAELALVRVLDWAIVPPVRLLAELALVRVLDWAIASEPRPYRDP